MEVQYKMDERFLIKVAFMADIFHESERYPTRAELSYLSGYFDKVAEFVFPVEVFEKTASYELDFDEFLDVVHAGNMQDLAMEKSAVGTGMGAGGWRSGGKQVLKAPDYTKGSEMGLWEGDNPLAWGANAGDWLDRGSRNQLSAGQQITHDLIPGVYGTGLMRQGWKEGGLDGWGKMGKGLAWNALDLIGVGRIPAGLKALGFLGKGLKNSKFIRGIAPAARSAAKWVGNTARSAGKWIGNTAKSIGSGAKKVFTGALNKAKGWWNKGVGKVKGWFGKGPKAKAPATQAAKSTTTQAAKGGFREGAKKWGGRAMTAANLASIPMMLGWNPFGGGQNQQAPGSTPMMTQGPTAQGHISSGPGQGSYNAGSSFNLGATPTAPKGDDSRYAGFLNKFKHSGRHAAGNAGSFFK
jgi:hypothetical protein